MEAIINMSRSSVENHGKERPLRRPKFDCKYSCMIIVSHNKFQAECVDWIHFTWTLIESSGSVEGGDPFRALNSYQLLKNKWL
jgi:hypothetical protein